MKHYLAGLIVAASAWLCCLSPAAAQQAYAPASINPEWNEIKFSHVGEFSGGERACQIKRAQCDPTSCAQLTSLLNQSGLLSQTKAVIKLNPCLYQNSLYVVEVSGAGGSHKAAFDIRSMPPEYKSLVDYLDTHAQTANTISQAPSQSAVRQNTLVEPAMVSFLSVVESRPVRAEMVQLHSKAKRSLNR